MNHVAPCIAWVACDNKITSNPDERSILCILFNFKELLSRFLILAAKKWHGLVDFFNRFFVF